MLDNAVDYYRHLREQEVGPTDALAHAVQRFGVSEKDLRARVNGRVADHDGTMQALAEAKAHLANVKRIQRERDEKLPQAWQLLLDLYEAVTGETL